MDSTVEQALSTELRSFQNLWHGGYFEGDPLHPLAGSTYAQLGFMSALHATYLRCIKPYVTPATVALELGPGRGAWTRCLLPARRIFALDALSAQHNGIFEFLGHPANLDYFQVSDFECNMLPQGQIDFMFSFGCLCHVSFDGITRYAERIYPKLRSGSNCFWMICDAGKYNSAYAQFDIWDAVARLVPVEARPVVAKLKEMSSTVHRIPPGQTEPLAPGQFYVAGVDRTCKMLQSFGYEIIDPDVGTNLRDPIIHFRRP